MRQGDAPNPQEEFFYRLLMKPAFQTDLVAARKLLKVPRNGFKDDRERLRWHEGGSREKSLTFLGTLSYLSNTYKIPQDYFLGIEDCLFFGKAKFFAKQKVDPAIILPPIHLVPEDDCDHEALYKTNGEPYARLIIPGRSTKSEVLSFIEQNWDRVETILQKQGWKRLKKNYPTEKKERNILIKMLWNRSIKSLRAEVAGYEGNRPGLLPKYREILIQRILKNRGHGNVGDATIKKIGSIDP